MSNFVLLRALQTSLGPKFWGLSLTPKRPLSSMKTRSLDLGGIFPPIVTPFTVDEKINYEMLQKNIEKWEKIDFKGYVVQGSNGEYVYLDPEERVEMVKQVKQKIGSGKLLIAGSGCESTRSTIEMTSRMAGVGADAALVVTPCYYKSGMKAETMIKHFTKVADSSPIPIILYSVPANTGIDLEPDVIIRLAHHPNIIALKDSGGDVSKLGYVRYQTRNVDFNILAGSASFLLQSFVIGCIGGVVALGNVLGEPLCQLYKLYQQKDLDAARELQLRLIGPNLAVTKQFGIAGLKLSMDWYGYYGGPTRSPIQSLSLPDIQRLRAAFTETGFL